MNIQKIDFRNFAIIEAPSYEDHKTLYNDNVIPLINAVYWDQQQYFFCDTPKARERINAKELEKILSDPKKTLYILLDKTKNIACGTILFERLPEKNKAKFGLFAIAKEYQGNGLGSALVNHVEEVAQSIGKRKMKIEVFIFATKLGKHYERLGYSYTGKKFEFPHGDSIRPDYQTADKLYVLGMRKKFN